MRVPLMQLGLAVLIAGSAYAAEVPNSYAPVDDRESFDDIRKRMEKDKPQVEKRFRELLEQRYDLADKPVTEVLTSGSGKPIQGGVRARLPQGVSWQELAQMTPQQIKDKALWPAGFLPLPHEHQKEGGMLFPQRQIDIIKEQENRDLSRFDLQFQLPEHFTPDFPPGIFLTTRPDLGNVAQGQVVTQIGRASWRERVL